MQIDEEYFKSEEFRELLDSYEASVDTGATPFMDADELVDIADYYNLHDELDKAEAAIDRALELYPDATLPNVFKARQALDNLDFDAARSYADRIGQRDDPDYHYLQAEILLAEGNTEKADRYLRDYGMTIEADEYEDFVKDCANLYIDYDLSGKAYEWMMRSRGDDSDDFKELMARTLFGLGKYKDSERLWDELIDSNPYSKHYWNALASAQYMSEDYSGSVTSSEYAIAIDPNDPESLLSKANGLFRLGNNKDALDYYKRYSELVPDDAFGLMHQGVCLVNMGRNGEAIEKLDSALRAAGKDSPYLAQIYQELAFCYSAAKNPQKALTMLDKTDQLDCDHADNMVVRGHILLENDMPARAEAAFKQALRMSDNDPHVMLRIIVSLYDNHYVNASYHALQQFLKYVQEHDPSFTGGNAYMALCCYGLGHSEEFLHYLRKAVSVNPNEARTVLGFLFPPGTDVGDYCQYMEQQLNAKP